MKSPIHFQYERNQRHITEIWFKQQNHEDRTWRSTRQDQLMFLITVLILSIVPMEGSLLMFV